MGVGLAIDRMLDLRSWRSWRAWSPVWRLLLVAMPAHLVGAALLGVVGRGLAPRPPCCGAVLAPTDPVLASDVQVGEPVSGVPSAARRRGPPTRTTTAVRPHRRGGPQRRPRLPVRHLALLLAAGGLGDRRRRLAGVDVVGKIARVLVGVGGRLAAGPSGVRARGDKLRLADAGEGSSRSAGLLASYGAGGAGRRLRVPGRLRVRDARCARPSGPRLPARDARRRRAARAPDHADGAARAGHGDDPAACSTHLGWRGVAWRSRSCWWCGR